MKSKLLGETSWDAAWAGRRSRALRLSAEPRHGERSPRLNGSQLFALIRQSQLELPSLVAHQHAAKLVPVDFSAVDD